MIVPGSLSAAMIGGLHPYTHRFVKRAVDEGVPLVAKPAFAVDRFVRGALGNGLWTKFGCFSLSALPNSVHSRIDLIRPTNTLFNVIGSPTFTANRGWKGGGTIGNYLEAPDTIANTPSYMAGGNDDWHFGVWAEELVNANAYIAGTAHGSLAYNIINPYLSGNGNWRVNQTNSWNGTATGTAGSWIQCRTGPSSAQAYYNGIAAGTNAVAGTYAGDNKMRFPGCGVSGTYSNQGLVRACFFGRGFNATDALNMHNLLDQLMNDLA